MCAFCKSSDSAQEILFLYPGQEETLHPLLLSEKTQMSDFLKSWLEKTFDTVPLCVSKPLT